jgi:hypothetical protein
MEKFMANIAPSVWPKGSRIGTVCFPEFPLVGKQTITSQDLGNVVLINLH